MLDKHKVESSNLSRSNIKLEYSQVVRHWFLILIYEGSNPSIPDYIKMFMLVA